MSSLSESLAPFPDNLPLAPIATVSYQKLLDGDRSEAIRVLEAAQTHGFFYLDLQAAPDGEALLSESEHLHALARNAFTLPLPEKLHYALERGVSLFGYKPAGTVKTTDRSQRPDTTEFFCVAKDHLHGVVATPPNRNVGAAGREFYPPALEGQWPLLQSFTARAHACGLRVLRVLAEQMGLAPDAFARLNRFDRPSGDHCRLTRKQGAAARQSEGDATDTGTGTEPIGLPSHTDFGSVTLLFNWLGGLQIELESPKEEGAAAATATDGTTSTTKREWAWVKPLPGHAIVNLGDAMVIFTRGHLRSAKHRVVPAPGAQATADRYSVVYFVRPHNAIPMRPLAEFDDGSASLADVAGKFSAVRVRGEGEVLTAGEWMRQRGVQLGN